MSEDCIFCGIAEGDIPSRTVYEEPDAVAFLDANPLARGHTVVIPKAHYQLLSDLPQELTKSVFGAVREVTPRVQAAVDADGHTIAINDGPAAGQEVPHLHVHIVPRFEGDGGGPIHAIVGQRPDLDDDELDDIADDIRE